MKNIVLVFLLFAFIKGNAQSLSNQVINSTGGIYQTLEYSVGEVVITTVSNSSNILTQGFLQPNDTTTVTGVNNVITLGSINYYPNPVIDYLNIKTDKVDIKKIEIIDALGRLIYTSNFSEQILLSTFSKGIYFVRLYNENKTTNYTFKINKI
ncbi:MAG: T9SS type A sorting domain-containing protein [Bacteroidetes bacterium]|nr:T9SS type A sorting domain-containing protein [Bacteroidota bacterium]